MRNGYTNEQLTLHEMAELPDLGKHCTVENCHQLDFLPFKCNGCLQTFCSEHRTETSHKCTKENVVVSSTEYTGPKGITCFLEGCNNRELTPIMCEKCKTCYCLSHRHAQDHNCPNLVSEQEAATQQSKTAQHVNQIIASKPAKPRVARGGKSSKTAAKVALMKMKLHSVGERGTPEEDKVYFCVVMPRESQLSPKPMFFSKTWSVGRLIDSVASTVQLRNDNNLIHSQKLRLFVHMDGRILPTEQTLDSFLQQETLFSGSAVVLEYVENDCVQLEDITNYKVS